MMENKNKKKKKGSKERKKERKKRVNFATLIFQHFLISKRFLKIVFPIRL